MSSKLIHKMKNTFAFGSKLFVLTAVLFSQLMLSEIFLYQNNPDASSINIAKADAGDTWYNTAYLYRKEITVNSAKVPNTDQTNFPVLISLTDNALRTVANGGKINNASGYDIIFADQIGANKLDHEIESYDGATGTIAMWVKIPTLSHLNNTVIYMYYGNTNISTTQENKTGVWDSNFKGVWHLKETGLGLAGDYKDSTVNANNSINTSGQPTINTSGKVGNGENFSGQYVGIDNPTPLRITGDLTISAWIKPSIVSGTRGIVGKANVMNKASAYIFYLSEGKIDLLLGNSSVSYTAVSSSTLSINNWYFITATVSGTTMQTYIEGAADGSPVTFSGSRINSADPLGIGYWDFYLGSARLTFPGSIDEVRISNAARSSDWIASEYNNQSNPTPAAGNFILPLGIEESYATTYNLTAPSPSSGLINIPSQNFTITPSGIYTGTITITPSGGGLSTAITKTFTNSSTPQTFTITPTLAGTVTLTMTNNSSLTNPSAVTYGSISISANPSSIIQGSTGNIITLTGISTSWTNGTPGAPTYTLSGGTGASIAGQIVTDPTHATLNINAGSATGDLTITDPSSGATATITVAPSTFMGMVASAKPVIQLQDYRIDTNNLPQDIIQIAISRTSDFKDVSWEIFRSEEIKQLDTCPDKLYIKFRNKSGSVSDVIIYTPKTINDNDISNLQDGDIVKTLNSPDVYIIKMKNNKQYKRLILSPQVFKSYGHLKWTNIKIISQEELNQYVISDLVKETADIVIYELLSNGDAGERRVFDINKPYDAGSVYEINKTDRNSYRLVE